MSEINRISKLFSDLQHGDCWIGTNFKATLHGLNAATASKIVDEKANSIWHLVFHVIYWRTKVINRLNGNLNPPPFPDFKLPDELNEENWKLSLQDFETTYHQLRSTINHCKAENLELPSPKAGQTYYQLIMGCLQHDAYHLGQMALLRKIATGMPYEPGL